MTIPKFGDGLPDVSVYTDQIWAGGQRLVVDPLTGAATYRYHLPLSQSRLTPSLTLEYNSSARNSAFGWGWSLTIPFIGRSTSPDMPRYREADDDSFEFGTEALVPSERDSDRFTVGEYMVQRYRRTIEGQHDRVERWQHQPSGQSHWRVTDADNVTSLYGSSDESRESDPSISTRTLRWLLTERFDDRGNIIRYVYKRENLDNVEVEVGLEKHRKNRADAQGGTRYLKRIQYGNSNPHDRTDWHFQVVLDYGEHDVEFPEVTESQTWATRPDVFSDNRAGFERRSWRRCQRVLMFHQFDDLGGAPALVSATSLSYDDSTGRSLLNRIQHTGYIARPDAPLQKRALPPIEFAYQRPDFDDTVHSLDSDVIVGALLDDRSGARWLDLYDEALPGLAMRVGGNWCFVRNYGGGDFSQPEAVTDTFRLESEEPDVIDLSEVEGTEGELAPAHQSGYRPLSSMRSTANVNQDDPYVGYLDLNGDMADDVVVADENVIRWYPSQGEAGFGDPVVMHLDANGPVRPARLHADERQSLWVADMTGDGLFDLVRIRSGEVSYWPHQGRGRFGDRVVMDASPTMPANDAGVGRLLLGDLTATGTADLVWIDNGEVRYWENLNGAHFGSPRRASAPGIAPGGPGVGTVDLFGRGSDSIVWIDQTSGVPSLRYISPIGERRANLLSSVNNGRGGETRCSYISTAELRRRDRAAGRDQLTTLALPVQVVERVEHRDYVADIRDLTRYVFRHGATDDQTRTFIGFAYREEWKSGSQEEYVQPGLFPHEPAIGTDVNKREVPTLRRTWRHTGVLFEGEDLASELTMDFFADPKSHKRTWLRGNLVPMVERARDLADAFASLRGRVIRDEFYDVARGTADIPSTVDEYTWAVDQIQGVRNGHSGSYQAHSLEHVCVHYDLEGNDPRIDHELTLEADEYGSLTRTARVAYARRQPADSSQAVTYVQLNESSFSNQINHGTWYRVRLPLESTDWELSGSIPPIGELYEPGEIAQQFNELSVVTPGISANGPYKRIVKRERVRYWSNDSIRLLEAGQIESKALVARTDHLAFSDAIVRQFFDERDVSDTLRYEGGYQHEDGLWWASGLTTTYSPATFYLPVSTRDSVGRQKTFRYNSTALAVREIEDGYGNIAGYFRQNRVSQPWQYIDFNHNVVADRFDALGNLLSRAVMGKLDAEQGDALALDSREATGRDDPTLVVTYAPYSSETGMPSYVRLRQRVEFRGNKANLVDSYRFFDSEGRLLASSSRSDDGPWSVEGYSVLDSAGRVVAVAQPFLSDNAWPEDKAANEALASCRAFRYDALGRIIRIDEPGGTYSSTEFGPWWVTQSDANDNVLDTAWYADRHGASQGRAADFAARAMQQYEARAAAMAAVHANTPELHLLDANGRVVVRRLTVAGPDSVSHRYSYNAAGDIISVTDSRALVVKRTSRDLMGRVVRIDHADAGVAQFLLAASGETLRYWDPLGRATRYRYDANGRMTHAYFDPGVGPEILTDRVIWGGGEVTIADVEANNLIGVAHMKLASAGLEIINSCDWRGNVVSKTVYAATDYETLPNWSPVDAISNSLQLLPYLTKANVLNAQAWKVESSFDALDRVTIYASEGVGTVFSEYGHQQRLLRSHIQLTDGRDQRLIEEARYDSAGRLSIIRFGNGTWVRRLYNAAGQIAHIVTAARGREESLQDLSIAYDPNGNVTIVGEGSNLAAAYTYDGLGRLIKAEGRTLEGGIPYADSYALDSEGNILEYRHKSGSTDATTAYDYQAGRNQLRAVTLSDPSTEPFSATYQYDAGGNLIHSPDRFSYRWNKSGLLTRIETEDGTVVHLGYALDGTLMRRVTVAAGGREIKEEIIVDGFERTFDLANQRNEVRQVALLMSNGVPVARIEGSEVAFQLVDHTNSVTAEVDARGEVSAMRAYSPYGKMVSTEDISKPRFGFLGEEVRAGSYLYRCNHRWYDPMSGRYIQPNQWEANETNAYLFHK